METRARKKFLTSPNFGFSADGRVLSRGLCAMGSARRKMRAFHYAVVAFALILMRCKISKVLAEVSYTRLAKQGGYARRALLVLGQENRFGTIKRAR